DFSILQEVKPSNHFDIQVKLAKMSYQLLKADIKAFSRENIFQRYRLLLGEKNLLTTSNRIRQKELFGAFQAKFPNGYLDSYDSALVEEDEYNWLKVLIRNEKRQVHPLRHLFLLYFLDKDVEELLDVGEDEGPFGKGPWPCLNKAADHYKQPVIQHVNITRDYKSSAPIGTFECSCKFVYARKGPDPDKSSEDIYRIGRVKVFGHTWEAKLQALASKEDLSIRAMAKTLGVDSKTVKKYLSKDEQKEKSECKVNPQMLQQYQHQLLEGMQQYPNDSRTQIRERFQKEYIYLYRHDRKWLLKYLPGRCGETRTNNIIVDWSARDADYCAKIKQLHNELMALKKPVRITNSLIGKRLGILSNLEKHLSKLPKTKKLLGNITESVPQFQIRRCCKVIDQMLQKKEPVLLWKVQRIGAVKSHHFHEIKPHLEAYIHMKREVDNHGRTTS
ncbi:TnsD family Tn7-like transposition protein, partial [Staphylococcus epidermidis]